MESDFFTGESVFGNLVYLQKIVMSYFEEQNANSESISSQNLDSAHLKLNEFLKKQSFTASISRQKHGTPLRIFYEKFFEEISIGDYSQEIIKFLKREERSHRSKIGRAHV